ncbi:hypothetical protein COV88_03795 [Candidatus Saccharibacteria bacterium CG11_big_fil_rev_8_21_14_0_20_41_19]|nr:hypothetical protein [Candidatus Saccharibacteria bacterium]OIP85676.1 MAG: hypothetical protein AUK57_02305 [Candidatus Saccharibacteria bacterium CG2_30_41_52]PIQ70547.1 MAG: hypothetical protein COV88_03795 [Candidatus Saccharibacteria bacterium CG11_big_fil_rev_8_21_14_0_20_41_19]PIZ60873.1 MAG: hypothetical protein COY18_00625 [Candidatus Saccharibacteria bacterium CG_4_10_14_0_2_um_filter_41_11]PJC29442.1 MAG: hypothetical protein CO052_03300 [Candidatus Saccharibacteria bacterium CG_4
MKALNQAGFTIIETMLFLGITGLLVMGVLVGAGTSINIQRYHDSVTSLQSTIQHQFSEVANVSNDSLSNPCYGDSSVNNPRGQSDCVILGRFITSTDGHTLQIKNVIGYIPGSQVVSTNDVDALKEYNVRVSPSGNTTYDMEWGSSMVHSGGNNPMLFSMLTLRSPISGIVRTFIDPNAMITDPNISTLISQNALMQSAKVCVNSNGLFTGGKSAVFINANVTSATGVETMGEATSGC